MARLERPGAAAIDLASDALTIGRDSDNDIVVADEPRASRLHARLIRSHGVWQVADAGSRNGTFLNGARLNEPSQLRHGDELRIGDTTMTFHDDPDPDATLAADASPRDGTKALSERERQIVALVANGLTDREIARDLYLSPATVRSHLDRIRDKTGRRRRSELTQLAIELRLL